MTTPYDLLHPEQRVQRLEWALREIIEAVKPARGVDVEALRRAYDLLEGPRIPSPPISVRP